MLLVYSYPSIYTIAYLHSRTENLLAVLYHIWPLMSIAIPLFVSSIHLSQP